MMLRNRDNQARTVTLGRWEAELGEYSQYSCRSRDDNAEGDADNAETMCAHAPTNI
jgi:hypothetical protein